MLFSRPSSSGTASVLPPPSGSANRPESLKELPSLFRSKAKHSYSFDELWHQLRLISHAPSGILCGSALTAGMCFSLSLRPVLRRSTEKKVPVTAETGIMSAITVRALAA